eukprot:TRINITY_DN26384_c0_g1_i1.p1 TRINITY_DN26384_c0_g1~~TRINITY_DN26384_c0_g1_i1.p1  ORF type:complete len:853 (+),score=239.95 TRINITY_DN26384_c0_g1_i1:163-2721(+)
MAAYETGTRGMDAIAGLEAILLAEIDAAERCDSEAGLSHCSADTDGIGNESLLGMLDDICEGRSATTLPLPKAQGGVYRKDGLSGSVKHIMGHSHVGAGKTFREREVFSPGSIGGASCSTALTGGSVALASQASVASMVPRGHSTLADALEVQQVDYQFTPPPRAAAVHSPAPHDQPKQTATRPADIAQQPQPAPAKPLELGADPVVIASMEDAILALREKLNAAADAHKELAAHLGQELQQMQTRGSTLNEKHDMLVERLRVANEALDEKMAVSRKQESALRSQLTESKQVCETLRTLMKTGPEDAASQKLEALEKQGVAGGGEEDRGKLAEDTVKQEEELRSLLDQERSRTRSCRANLGRQMRVAGMPVSQIPSAWMADAESAAQSSSSTASAAPAEEGSKDDAQQRPVQKLSTWQPSASSGGATVGRSGDVLLKSFSVGHDEGKSVGGGAHAKSSATSGADLEAALAACEGELASLQQRLPDVIGSAETEPNEALAKALHQDCLQLGAKLQELTGEALESVCSRSVAGAMEVFEGANEAIEKLVTVMQACKGASKELAEGKQPGGDEAVMSRRFQGLAEDETECRRRCEAQRSWLEQLRARVLSQEGLRHAHTENLEVIAERTARSTVKRAGKGDAALRSPDGKLDEGSNSLSSILEKIVKAEALTTEIEVAQADMLGGVAQHAYGDERKSLVSKRGALVELRASIREKAEASKALEASLSVLRREELPGAQEEVRQEQLSLGQGRAVAMAEVTQLSSFLERQRRQVAELQETLAELQQSPKGGLCCVRRRRPPPTPPTQAGSYDDIRAAQQFRGGRPGSKHWEQAALADEAPLPVAAGAGAGLDCDTV